MRKLQIFEGKIKVVEVRKEDVRCFNVIFESLNKSY